MKSNKKQRNEILTQAYWRGLLAKHRALFVSFAARKGVLSCWRVQPNNGKDEIHTEIAKVPAAQRLKGNNQRGGAEVHQRLQGRGLGGRRAQKAPQGPRLAQMGVRRGDPARAEDAHESDQLRRLPGLGAIGARITTNL